MHIALTVDQQRYRQAAREFVQSAIAPHADQYDREERLPVELVTQLARAGYLGAVIPREHHGAGLDMIALGLLHEEVGKGCSSVHSLLTVHSMVAHTLARWGNAEQKSRWLPQLAAGDAIAAFWSQRTAGRERCSGA
jgi:alkylation response protein AidB-like acyl-CoA dehydrogenase